MGAGAEVMVRGGDLVLKPLTRSRRCDAVCAYTPTIPTTRGVFRVEFPAYGKDYRVVFNGGPEDGGTATRLLMEVLSFRKRPDVQNPRPWVNGALLAGATALAARRRRHQRAAMRKTRF